MAWTLAGHVPARDTAQLFVNEGRQVLERGVVARRPSDE
jgi:hypothetical protein